MAITVTENAAAQIAKQLARRGRGIGLHLGVKKAGCSGYAYVVDYADAITADDAVFEQHGVKVLVNAGDLAYLDGVEIDYAREGLNEAFRFHNPKATASCGCGESFAV
ncbi:MAG: iron-sulfur cluster assembly accessory protein [Methylococcus sp.]|nr:iron-sulfur cluster assembly accessory protein [Methylococcus sp.]